MNKTYLTIFCTVPNEETALTISRDLVENQLAACCNILPGIRSIYSWKGEICDDTEYLLIIKTRMEAYEKLETRIKELHPYEVPEIIALEIKRGWRDYLTWMDENVK